MKNESLKNDKKKIGIIDKNYIFNIIKIVSIFILLSSFKKDIFEKNKKNEIKVCLCVIGKKENLYVKEFISHYKRIGYDKIFIYDNNDINDEKFDEVIKSEIDSGFVSIINYRGYKGLKIRPQFDAYKNCYQKYNHKFEWLSFFDFDEFLEFKYKGMTIKKFLKTKKFEKCQSVKINWIIYGNNNSLLYEDKPLKERFNIAELNNLDNKHIKSTVRGNLSINYWNNMKDPHSSSYKEFISCSSSGKIISSSSPFNYPPDYKNAYIKHYRYKSFEEHCLKIKRARSDYTSKENKKDIMQLIKDLYLKNKGNDKKIKIMKTIFKEDFLAIKSKLIGQKEKKNE